MKFEEYLASAYQDLEIGHVTPITGLWCKHCHSTDLYMEVGLEPTDSQGSLAGHTVKMTAYKTFTLCCATCGRRSGDGKGE